MERILYKSVLLHLIYQQTLNAILESTKQLTNFTFFIDMLYIYLFSNLLIHSLILSLIYSFFQLKSPQIGARVVSSVWNRKRGALMSYLSSESCVS